MICDFVMTFHLALKIKEMLFKFLILFLLKITNYLYMYFFYIRKK